MFFAIQLENPIIDCLVKLALSMFVGCVLGVERKITQHVVGIRTFVLIAVSSCLMMEISIFLGDVTPKADASRIAAQVVTGVGFIGAGTILRQGLNITGITTASIIWTASALGLGIGAGMIIPSLIALAISVVTLIIFSKFESLWFPSESTKMISLEFSDGNVEYSKIEDCIKSESFLITDMSITENLKNKEAKVVYSVKALKKGEIKKLLESLQKLDNLEKISCKIK